MFYGVKTLFPSTSSPVPSSCACRILLVPRDFSFRGGAQSPRRTFPRMWLSVGRGAPGPPLSCFRGSSGLLTHHVAASGYPPCSTVPNGSPAALPHWGLNHQTISSPCPGGNFSCGSHDSSCQRRRHFSHSHNFFVLPEFGVCHKPL